MASTANPLQTFHDNSNLSSTLKCYRSTTQDGPIQQIIYDPSLKTPCVLVFFQTREDEICWLDKHNIKNMTLLESSDSCKKLNRAFKTILPDQSHGLEPLIALLNAHITKFKEQKRFETECKLKKAEQSFNYEERQWAAKERLKKP